MAHAHKRTLLQSLAFADKDRGGDHDLICIYLSDRKSELIERFIPQTDAKPTEVGAVTEMILNKGEGQYKTTVGFLDVVVKRTHANGMADRLGIEVKNSVTPVSEVIKQIKLYSQYYPATAWLLVTAYQISTSDKKALAMAGIKHTRIGERFQEWKRANDQQALSDEF